MDGVYLDGRGGERRCGWMAARGRVEAWLATSTTDLIPEVSMEVLLVISGILQLAQTLASDASKAKAEGRDPTPDEMARMKAAQTFVEQQWLALAPKEDA